MRILSPTLIGLIMSALLLCANNESIAASQSNLTATLSSAWVKKADMLTARNRLSVAVVDGKIYAIGGTIGGGRFSNEGESTVEEYDPVTNVWTKKADMPTARQWLSTTVVSGKIFAIGGLDKYFGKVLKTVEVYDPVSDSWERKADMPTAKRNVSVTVVDGKIYAIGGTDSSNCPPSKVFSSVEEYDPITSTWVKKADMPTPRAGISLCTVGGKIYAIGGFNSYNGLRTVEVYNPKTDMWTKRSEMPTKRLLHSAGVVNGRIYVIGGPPWGPRAPHKTVEEYDPDTDIWTTIGTMATPRMDLSAGVVNGKIYVIGGSIYFGSSPLSIVEEYDPGIYSQSTPQGKRPFKK